MALEATLEESSTSPRGTSAATLLLGILWCAFQLAIILWPQQPMVARPMHLFFALTVLFLNSSGGPAWLKPTLVAASGAVGAYFLLNAQRLADRVEAVDPILSIDIAAGLLLVLLLLEGVRRCVGWSLLGLLLFTLLYSFAGPWFPGWSRFSGFRLEDTIEIMTMTTNGVLGVTTETSVQFVFYFLMFGSAYAAIGGGRLFIDIGLKTSGRQQGAAAKAAVVSSSLMGTISGSAVANVVSVGVFTIPLMRRAGYSAVNAAAIEALASTGGQLMPPVMGVAAFVMAEMLQMDYGRIAMAALIPAVAFYFALFVIVDLGARKSGIGTLDASQATPSAPIWPRLYLLLPPVLLIALLASGKSATLSVVAAIAACVISAYLRRDSWVSISDWLRVIEDVARQAAQVAIPIAAIGIMVAVAVQSNLALRFSSKLIAGGAANVHVALLLTVIGCIVMGMGLPTVAAYIIGAILFVPTLIKLGLTPLCAHFFVMYYCVLSMITPPVALASFASAGLAKAGVMETGWQAFRLSLVLFLIAFGFAFDPLLLGQGPLPSVMVAFAGLLTGTGAWAVALVGYLNGLLSWGERFLYGAVAVANIVFPTLSVGWNAALLGAALLCVWNMFLKARVTRTRAATSAEGA
ncbi:MAG: TRAP transporter fused permease subunit [Acidobacteria bacterium]|nr:TRAP transporter fused permease subunit [Acidobacteriota bacterium]